MDFMSSPLYNEVEEIQKKGNTNPYHIWSVYFKIKDTYTGPLVDEDSKVEHDPEEKDRIFKPMKLMSLDREEDYINGFGDSVKVEVMVPMGMWAKILYPARDHVSVVVVRKNGAKALAANSGEFESEEVTFDAAFEITPGLMTESASLNVRDRDDLDTGYPPVRPTINLLNPSLEKIRRIYSGTIARNAKPADVVKAVFANALKNIPAESEDDKLTFTMVDPDNTEKRDHIVIPPSIPLMDLPIYIQKKAGGIYNTGMGCYMKGNDIHVFSTNNIKRYDEEEEGLILIVVPKDRFPGVPTTYKTEGGRTTVMVTAPGSFTDFSKTAQLAAGNGIRLADARTIMNGYAETKDNKAIVSRKENNHEYVFNDLQGQNNVIIPEEALTSNIFEVRSKQSKLLGGVANFLWENCDTSLIKPAMPVKVLYLTKDGVQELRGIVQGVQQYVATEGTGIVVESYRNSAALFVFISAYDEEAIQ